MRGTKRRAYLVGFGLSVFLTLDAYLVVSKHLLEGGALVAAIVAMALVQLGVQLVCFLHLGKEARPRWNLLAFGFMALVVAVLVFGSLWIMSHLNYHMPPTETETYILQDEGIGK